jgi:exosome complex component RRP43
MVHVDATLPPTIAPEALVRLNPAEYYSRFLDASIRPDGRALGHSRPVSIALGAVATAAGSASVRVGRTLAVAAVSAEPMLLGGGAPGGAATATHQGELLIRLECPAICGAKARGALGGGGGGGGAPDPVASANALLGAALERSRVLADDALVIAPGRAAWRLCVDVYCLDFAGNLPDAALLAALAALAHVALPAARFDADARRVLVGAEAGPAGVAGMRPAGALALTSRPVALSFATLLGRTLADPSAEEEALADGQLTAVVDERGRLRELHKPGGAPLADAELRACVDAARARAPVLLELLADALRLAGAQ